MLSNQATPRHAFSAVANEIKAQGRAHVQSYPEKSLILL